jgi:hypothetical protein
LFEVPGFKFEVVASSTTFKVTSYNNQANTAAQQLSNFNHANFQQLQILNLKFQTISNLKPFEYRIVEYRTPNVEGSDGYRDELETLRNFKLSTFNFPTISNLKLQISN